jgi:selenocysteine-specific elongation factor
VCLMPANKSARVRSIHAQNRAAASAQAGQRCALNLVGLDTSELSRGDWLADPRALMPSRHMDVRLQWLGESTRARRHMSLGPLHVHIGTAHQMARVVPLEREESSFGQPELAQLVFAEPLCAARGDRFILRDSQGSRTIGGGAVLDPVAPARKRRAPERLAWLRTLESLDSEGSLSALIEKAPHGLSIAVLSRLSGLPPERIELPADVRRIETGKDTFLLNLSHWARLRERVLEALRDFHVALPDEPGPDVGRLRRIALPSISDTQWRAVIEELVDEGRVARKGPWLSLPDHTATLSQDDQNLLAKLQPLIAAGRFDPPWVRDLAAVTDEPEQRVRDVLRKAVTQGTTYQVVRDLFYVREHVSELAVVVNRIAQEDGVINAARYRDAVGLGRKRAIQILEFFDRIGYTRRIKDCHVLRPDSGWVP